MTRALALVPLMLGVLGCAPDERVPLSECEFGLYWAECGGNGGPVLGCERATGDCRWFGGGETARGYAVSDCPLSEPCCHDGWAFTDYAPGDRVIRRNAAAQLYLLRQGVVSREAGNEVTVTADLEGETQVGWIRCETPVSGCNTSGGSVTRVGDAIVLTAGSQWGSSGGWYRMEIVPSESPEPWTVRLYQFATVLDEGQEIPLVCAYFTMVDEVPLTGVLHVNTLDTSDVETFHGRLEATTDLGVQFSIEF